MPKYQYSAVNKQGKNLSGIISAQNDEQAKNKLKALKLTVVAIEQIPETKGEIESKTKYKFEAKNKENQKVVGTIEADSILGAFKRLIDEYELTVIKLAGITATDLEFETSQAKVQQLYAQNTKLQQTIENDTSKEEYIKEQRKREFIKTIEEIITIMRGILNEFEADLKPESKQFLEKYAEHMEKIKFSDNIESTIASAAKILKYLQTQEMYLNQQANAEEKLNHRLDFMQKFGQLKKIGRNQTGEPSAISKALSALGVEGSGSGGKLGQIFGRIKDELALLFTAKSQNARKVALKGLGSHIKEIFKKSPKSTKSDTSPKQKSTSRIGKLETELHKISFWLSGLYLIYYFISSFVSEKVFLGELHPIFYTYHTTFLIYFIVAIIFIHSAIHLRILLHKHKILHSTIVYPLFSLLYLMILINF